MKVQCEILATQLLAAPFGEVSTKYKVVKVFLGVVMLGGFAFFSATMATPLGLTRTISVIVTSSFIVVGLGLLGGSFYLERKRQANQAPQSIPHSELQYLYKIQQEQLNDLEASFQAMNDLYQEQIAALRDAKASLERGLASASADKAQLPELLEERERLSSELERIQREHETERSRLHTQLEEYRTQLEQYRRLLEDRMQALQSEHEVMRAKHESLFLGHGTLKAAHDALQSRHEEIIRREEASHRGHQEELLRNTKSLEQSKLELEAAQRRFFEREQELSRMYNDNTEKIQQLFQGQFQEERSRNEQLQNKNGELALELERIKADQRQINEEERKDAAKPAPESALPPPPYVDDREPSLPVVDAQRDAEILEQRRAVTREMFEEMQRKLRTEQEKNRELRTELTQAQNAFFQEKLALRQELSALGLSSYTAQSELQQQIRQAQFDLRQQTILAESTMESLRSDLEGSQLLAKNFEARVRDSEEKVNSLKRENEILEANLQQVRVSSEDARNIFVDKNKELGGLAEKFESRRQELLERIQLAEEAQKEAERKLQLANQDLLAECSLRKHIDEERKEFLEQLTQKKLLLREEEERHNTQLLEKEERFQAKCRELSSVRRELQRLRAEGSVEVTDVPSGGEGSGGDGRAYYYGSHVD